MAHRAIAAMVILSRCQRDVHVRVVGLLGGEAPHRKSIWSRMGSRNRGRKSIVLWAGDERKMMNENNKECLCSFVMVNEFMNEGEPLSANRSSAHLTCSV